MRFFPFWGKSFCDCPLKLIGTDTVETVVVRVRLPRAIMAALVGAGLSMSGASFQGMFQNPLVSPFVLGVSAGSQLWCGFGAWCWSCRL